MFSCFIILAVVGVLNAAIAATYYLRLIGVMYFDKPNEPLAERGDRGCWIAMSIATSLIVVLGFFPGRAMRSARTAEQVQKGRFVQILDPDEPEKAK